jgi:hypothetical protein
VQIRDLIEFPFVIWTRSATTAAQASVSLMKGTITVLRGVLNELYDRASIDIARDRNLDSFLELSETPATVLIPVGLNVSI